MEIPVELISDEKGYLDRECPNENCEFVFKINMNDWTKKIDEKVYCPRCGHIATTEQWWTQEQLKHMTSLAKQWVMSEIQNTFQKSFKSKSNKYFNVTFKPGKRISFQNNPIGQREEWELEIHCEQCGTRTSVIGTAYFCPCCGMNAVDRLFNESLDRIKKQLSSLNEMQTMLEGMHDKDTAVTISQNLIETSLKDVISAYQKFAVETFRKGYSKKVTPNDFQIVDKGSTLFEKHYDKGYHE
ncbi:hypothetical protein ACTWQB_14265 [Piscibacillus sp. B03]|uniref:hypothetical protein n=1 Tax=Piscibacillus sp. B03 TaxID=3457430 RepID=UPI003FCDD16F